jgi:hypothetical protein
MFDPTIIKFGEPVWHDESYTHPQLRRQFPKDFYGREIEKSRLEMILRSVSRKPAIIIGERRSGKTSLLRLIAEKLANDPSRGFISVLIPWQGIQSRDMLAKEILQGVHAWIGKQRQDSEQPASFKRDLNTTGEFIATLRQLLMPISDKTVIICIDEFDSIVEDATPDEQDKIFGLAHALIEITDLPISLFLTMARIPNIPETRSSPVIAKSEQIFLHPFSLDEFNNMIEGLLGESIRNLPSEDLKRLFELSGGWPYFAKLLLKCLAELPPEEATLDQAVTHAVNNSNVEQALSDIYTMHFDDSEKTMVLLLAERNGRVGAEEMMAVDTSLKVAADQLTKRGFVLKDKNGSYSFRIGFLKDWFRNWVKYKLEVERHLTEILQCLERLNDPWAYSEPTVVYDNEL